MEVRRSNVLIQVKDKICRVRVYSKGTIEKGAGDKIL